jgi:hypothetical protein
VLSPSPRHLQLLTELLGGERRASHWLKGPQARNLLGSVKVGSVPRDVQLVAREGELVVGVESVHAFLQAELFWWMVSILWTIAISSEVEPLLGDGVMGFRFQRAFLEDPATSGVMFGDPHRAHERWQRFPSRIAADHPDGILATNTLDIRAFYYSVDVRPGRIISAFYAAKGEPLPRSRALRVLTTLLDALHLRFAERCAGTQPRRGDLGIEGACPLPVGLPSSPVLANMLMSLVLDDLATAPDTLAVASYADDVIVMTPSLLDLDEKPADYFARLGLSSAEDPYVLRSPSTAGLAQLTLRLERAARPTVGTRATRPRRVRRPRGRSAPRATGTPTSTPATAPTGAGVCGPCFAPRIVATASRASCVGRSCGCSTRSGSGCPARRSPSASKSWSRNSTTVYSSPCGPTGRR